MGCFCFRCPIKVSTSQYEKDLVPLCNRGMNNYRTSESKVMISTAKEITGLSDIEVKVS